VRIEKDLRMTEANQLKRGLSLFDSATIVAGSMIGSRHQVAENPYGEKARG